MGKTKIPTFLPFVSLETPPRAWGRHRLICPSLLSSGNTPTCMGKTVFKLLLFRHKWKHPHVHGEDNHTKQHQNPLRETPPRAWGRHPLELNLHLSDGNTPTCMGKTKPLPVDEKTKVETPPRAWGRLPFTFIVGSMSRNTPTCMGKTS